MHTVKHQHLSGCTYRTWMISTCREPRLLLMRRSSRFRETNGGSASQAASSGAAPSKQTPRWAIRECVQAVLRPVIAVRCEVPAAHRPTTRPLTSQPAQTNNHLNEAVVSVRLSGGRSVELCGGSSVSSFVDWSVRLVVSYLVRWFIGTLLR